MKNWLKSLKMLIHMSISFGTYCLRSEVCEASVQAALKAGYRSIDTATIYRNEEAIGNSLRKLGDTFMKSLFFDCFFECAT